MQVLLMRHGEAVDTRAAGSDRDRWLSPSGRQTATKVGEALRGLGLQFACIYTSPLVRAVQTAEILAATQSEFRGPLEVQASLSSERGSTAEALEPVSLADDEDLIVLVTHMPKICTLGSRLCQRDAFPSFRTGSACLLQIDAGRGRIEWMLDPETLELKPC